MDESFLLLLHAGDQGVRWTLPGQPWARQYVPVLDTSRPGGTPGARTVLGEAATRLSARSVLLLRVERD